MNFISQASLKQQNTQTENVLGRASTALEKLEAMKQQNALRHEFKAAEQNLFLDKLRLDEEMERAIEAVATSSKLITEVYRVFAVE